MTNILKLHEITPFLINYAARSFKDPSIDAFGDTFSNSWSDETLITLKLTRMPSISAMDLTLKFLPVVGDIEESAQLVYDLYSTVLNSKALGEEEVEVSNILVGRHGFSFFADLVNTSKIFLILKQDEEEVSKPDFSFIPLPKNSEKALHHSIEMEFA